MLVLSNQFAHRQLVALQATIHKFAKLGQQAELSAPKLVGLTGVLSKRRQSFTRLETAEVGSHSSQTTRILREQPEKR
jgi:hypothetical protein